MNSASKRPTGWYMLVTMLSYLLLVPSMTKAAEILGSSDGTAVPGEYIVVLKKPGLTLQEQMQALKSFISDKESSLGVKTLDQYDQALFGFAVSASDEQIRALALDERVDYIEVNKTLKFNASQQNPTWGLDRVDSRSSAKDSLYNYNYTGSGVHAYIIDSGIRTSHQDFGGRVASTTNFVSGGISSGAPEDCIGHGSHVAGIVGGALYGVAKGVTLHNVRIAECNQSLLLNDLIAALNWVIGNAQRPAVVNFSIGTRNGISQALNDAVAAVTNSGITMVVSAGNLNANACLYSPSSVSSALVVGATDDNNVRAGFSNFGSCVDLFAPGDDILSVGNGSDASVQVMSGTSMSAPFVTGAVALLLQQYGNISPATVESYIRGNATRNLLGGLDSSTANRFLFSDGAPNTMTRLRHITYPCPPSYTEVAKIFQTHGAADSFRFSNGPQNWRMCSRMLGGQPSTLLKYAPNDCPSGYSRVAFLGAVVAEADGFNQGDGGQNWALCSRSQGKILTLLKHASNDCDFAGNYHRIAWLGGVYGGADGFTFKDGRQNWALCSIK